MSASPALDTLISGAAFKTAVAKIVRSARASGGRKELSARGIREALEAEFACDLSTCKNLILASITAALENNGAGEAAVDRDADNGESCSEPKRRKLSNKSDASPVRLRPLPTVSSRIGVQRNIVGERPFACGQCDFLSKTKGVLVKHQGAHAGVRAFASIACDECDYKCATQNAMTVHQRKHTGERPYACDECDYRAAEKGTLQRHKVAIHMQRASTNTPLWTCDECDFRSNFKGSLTRHMMMHTGERPFACDECDYQCVQSGALAQHKRKHTGERPFACDQCDFRSAAKGNLAEHKRARH